MRLLRPRWTPARETWSDQPRFDCDRCRAKTRVHIELAHKTLDVSANGVHAHTHLGCDVPGRQTVRHRLQYLELSRSQRVRIGWQLWTLWQLRIQLPPIRGWIQRSVVGVDDRASKNLRTVSRGEHHRRSKGNQVDGNGRRRGADHADRAHIVRATGADVGNSLQNCPHLPYGIVAGPEHQDVHPVASKQGQYSLNARRSTHHMESIEPIKKVGNSDCDHRLPGENRHPGVAFTRRWATPPGPNSAQRVGRAPADVDAGAHVVACFIHGRPGTRPASTNRHATRSRSPLSSLNARKPFGAGETSMAARLH